MGMSCLCIAVLLKNNKCYTRAKKQNLVVFEWELYIIMNNTWYITATGAIYVFWRIAWIAQMFKLYVQFLYAIWGNISVF